jgi:RNA polymerase sigma-70 factor (ECF subfamily)
MSFRQKRETFFDPTLPCIRKPVMLTITKNDAKRDFSGVLAETALATPKGWRDKGSKAVTTSAQKARAQWVDEIHAIRDRQDQAAFAAIFSHFAPRVKAFLIKGGASHDVAEECAQDVMATLWRKAHLFDPTKASASTWIFTIARNRRIDMIRKQRRPEPEELTWGPEPEPDQADAMALQQETEQLGVALAALPEKQRTLIQKAYFGDLSHSEIAEQTGLPLGTIKSRIRLALERLRHNMK